MDLNCIENNEINEKMIAEFNEKMLGMDNCLLNKSFMREEFLRQQLETVLENINCNNNQLMSSKSVRVRPLSHRQSFN